MKKRVFVFNGTEGAGEALANVLAHYAHVAYPVGGSDCAAASRQALQEIAAKIQNNELVDISTRQRPMLKSALKWFYSEPTYTMDEQMYERLLSQLQR